MESAVTIGLDLGKSVFQVHGVDAGGAVVVQRRLTRGMPRRKSPPPSGLIKALIRVGPRPEPLAWSRSISSKGHNDRRLLTQSGHWPDFRRIASSEVRRRV